MRENVSALIWEAMIISALFLFSCSKEDSEKSFSEIEQSEQSTPQETPQQPPEEEARYYVKYEMSAYYVMNINFSYKISYTKDNGIGTLSNNNVYGNGFKWDGTYGPFKKNDKVSLSCSISTSMPITALILVSRNQEPFATKAEYRNSSEKCSLEYIIDF